VVRDLSGLTYTNDNYEWQADVLRTIAQHPKKTIPYKELQESCFFSPSTSSISRWVDKAMKRGLLEAKRQQGRTTIYHGLTESGKKYVEDYHPCCSDWESQNPRPGTTRLHHSSVRVQLTDFEQPPDDWKKKAAQSKFFEFQDYNSVNDELTLVKQDYRIVISGDIIVIRLMNDITGYEVPSIASENVEKMFKALELVEDDLGLCIKRTPEMVLEMNTKHLAIVRDPFAEFVKERSDVSLQDVEIRDEEGELRLKMDCSEYPELEAGWGNKLSTKKFYADYDIMFIKRFLYEPLISHKKKWKAFIHALVNAEPEEIEKLFE
jgi:DNA-binding MarR family transcriptional regulator